MNIISNDKRNILNINGKKYMFFLCYKYNNEYFVSSVNRNMIVQYIDNIINISFLSDINFNIELKNIIFYIYAFYVDDDLRENLDQLKFIYKNFLIIKDLFKKNDFFNNIDNKFIKIETFELKENIDVKNNCIINLKSNVKMNINIVEDNGKKHIYCSHPSISFMDKELYDMLK